MFNFCAVSIRLAIEVVLQFLGYITFLPSTERHGLITARKVTTFFADMQEHSDFFAKFSLEDAYCLGCMV